jgi:undecaprenyl-diphosphatase
MLEAIILGIVQGLTEFFPVSSTAHLIVFPWIFNWQDPVNTLTFDIALHAGTLCALIACFWKDWMVMLSKNSKLFWLILMATLPAGVAGYVFNDLVGQSLRSPLIIVISLVVIGIVMLQSEKIFKRKKLVDLSVTDVLIIGCAQAVALIPGVSRSGITISAGLFRGLEREDSARFSFLLATPIIAGAIVLHSGKIVLSAAAYDPSIFAVGFLVSGITGVAAIKFLLGFLRKYPLNLFVYYRFILAVVIIIGIWLKR